MDTNTINRKLIYLIERFQEFKELFKTFEKKEKINKYKEEIERKIYISALERNYEKVVETTIKINIFILKENNGFKNNKY